MKLSAITISELEYRRDCYEPGDIQESIDRVLASPTIETLRSEPLTQRELLDILSIDAMRTDSGRPNADARRIQAELLRARNNPDDRYDPDSVCTHSRRTVVVDGVRYYAIA